MLKSSPTPIDHDRIAEIINAARAQGRDALFEHETYELLAASGAESVPGCVFVSKDESPEAVAAALAPLPGDRVVLKVVAPSITHKTEAGGVRIVGREQAPEAARAMVEHVGRHTDDVAGVLLVQFMPPDSMAFGNELLVSLRRTPDMGTVLTAGLGGTDTELYAASFRAGQAVVAASVALTDADQFLELFRRTIAYRKLAGLTRGQQRIVTDAQIRECFASFIAMGRAYGPENPDAGFWIDELEVNPFAFSDFRMMPLDGLCRFSAPGAPLPAPRPASLLEKMLHPTRIGIIGVSATRRNFGRIILENVISRGFDPKAITVVRPGCEQGATVDSAACVGSLAQMQPVDLFILAVAAEHAPDIIDELTERQLAASVILIPGGLEEREQGRERAQHMAERIQKAHANGHGPVILGGNSLGVLSHPGRYDTIFVPDAKLPQKGGGGRGRVALVSQSGGFLVTMASKFTAIDPSYMISVGNQMDVTIADLVDHLACKDHISVIAVYAEGFREGDGLALCRAVRRAVSCGKEVIFYKAGRTEAGKTATAGHTAAVAGDHMVSQCLLRQSGAMVAHSLSQFEDLYQLCSLFEEETVRGARLAAASGAGFEAVAMADAIQGDDYSLEMAEFSDATCQALDDLFREKRLAGLVQLANPLDMNPAADDETHLRVAELLLADPGVDAMVLGVDPLSPAMRTLPDGLSEHDTAASPDSIAQLLPTLLTKTDKPFVAVVDAGRLYDELARRIADGGVPVFRTADRAVAALGRFMEGRLYARRFRNGLS